MVGGKPLASSFQSRVQRRKEAEKLHSHKRKMSAEDALIVSEIAGRRAAARDVDSWD
jgi:hypothetical protein